jgi:hypothetical protein
MALLLCHKEAKYPYYYESLDLSIYSMEELAYAVGQYLPLVPKDFVSPPLCRWIMDGLERKEVGEKLLQLYEMGEKEERLLFRLLRESGYYTEKEIEELSLEWRRIHALSDAEQREKRGDCFFSLRKYKKAADAYQDAIHFEENGRRIRKLGECYIHTKEFPRAAESFRKLYEKNHDKMAARRLYFLAKMCFPKDKYKESFHTLEEGWTEEWEKEWQDTLLSMRTSPENREIEEAYRKGKEAFLSFAKDKIASWKEEIRGRV